MAVNGISGALAATVVAAPAEGEAKKMPAPAGRGKVVQLDAQIIRGKIQKPEAFYILQRSNLNYETLNPQRSFLPLILRTVEKAPF